MFSSCRKHQRTQGHIQATDLFDKKRADGLLPELEPITNLVVKEEMMMEGSETRSEDSLPAMDSSSSSVHEEEAVLDATKSSPKRKQSHPQQMKGDEEEQENIQPREELLLSNMEYNTATRRYDCRQCDFSSVEHSVTRDHVDQDHMRETAELQCKECMITFTKPFNLKIHNRKHETSSQFLPCEFCEQVFKVPNKLIKHMEGVHAVCPACGEKNQDKAELLEHMEKVHNEVRRGFHVNIQHLSNISSLLPAKHRFDIDSRHAKMRKLDTLAEYIRAKQLQNAHGTNAVNGNDKAPPSPLQEPPVFRKKNDLTILRNQMKEEQLRHHYAKPGIESLVSQLNNRTHGPSPIAMSENNNILSSLSKMSAHPSSLGKMQSEQPTFISKIQDHPSAIAKMSEHSDREFYQQTDVPEHEELTPPCSPPPSDARYTSNVILINNNPTACPPDDANETGLDLTLKKERHDETAAEAGAAKSEGRSEEYFPGRVITPTFPYIVPSLPFLSRMPIPPLQHPNNSFTEHLFKLASISRPPSHPAAPQDLSKPAANPSPSPVPTTSSHHNNVLSAMLAHRPPVPTSVFPVFGGTIPASMFPQHPLPLRVEENASSPVTSIGNYLQCHFPAFDCVPLPLQHHRHSSSVQ